MTSAGPARRWSVSLCAVMLAHGIAWVLFNRAIAVVVPPPPMDAIIVQMTLAPSEPEPDIQPAPHTQPSPFAVADPGPMPPVPLPLDAATQSPQPLPHLATKPKAAAVPHVVRPTPPTQNATPRQAMETPATPVPQPPATSQPHTTAAQSAATASQISANWQSMLVAHIARFKHYPIAAQRRGDQGATLVRFVMDHSGAVLSVVVVQSSGHAELDQEAIAWLQRAQPLPAPPPDVAQTQIVLVLPMRFEL